jgi:hypothetical protein
MPFFGLELCGANVYIRVNFSKEIKNWFLKFPEAPLIFK